jgi:glycosyltransferase involved in cell wall biosynthesis
LEPIVARRRLLAITHEFSASGAPMVLLDMLIGVAADYDISLIGPEDGPLRKVFLAAGINAQVIPNSLFDPNILSRLLLSCDLLLANTVQGFVAVHAARRFQKPSLWYVHEGQVGVQFAKLSPLIPAAFSVADCVGYAGAFQQSLYAPWRGDKRTEVLRYGVECRGSNGDGSPPLPPHSPPAEETPLQVLLLGSFEFRKGQDVALGAFRLLRDQHVQLNMFGRINNQDYYQSVMEMFRDVGNARYWSEIPKEQTTELIRDSDVVIVPSRDEATPLVILEAMALGRPVIASAVCGIPEMISDGETGFLFESENSVQLSSLISRLAADVELRSTLGANARRCQQEHWSLERSRRCFRDVLATL